MSERKVTKQIYHGRVQGVGFRWTSSRIATRFPVTGYVKNLPDGTVELLAAGSNSDVKNFLAEVASTFKRNITTSQVLECDSELEFEGFEIRR